MTWKNKVKYCKIADHANADALSHLPVSEDTQFDREEDDDDVDLVCTIKEVCHKISSDQNSL